MITNKDKRWIAFLNKMIKLSQHPKYHFSCCIIKGNRLISVGINKVAAPKRFIKRHRENMALHAEIDALLGIDKERLKNATLYIYGQTAAGNKMITRPCTTCLNFINQMNIKRVVYSNKEELLEIK